MSYKKGILKNFATVLNLAYNKNKLYKTLDYWSGDTLNFDFLEKGLEKVSLLHFPPVLCMIYTILTEQISLPDCLYLFEILFNMCITIVC